MSADEGIAPAREIAVGEHRRGVLRCFEASSATRMSISSGMKKRARLRRVVIVVAR